MDPSSVSTNQDGMARRDRRDLGITFLAPDVPRTVGSDRVERDLPAYRAPSYQPRRSGHDSLRNTDGGFGNDPGLRRVDASRQKGHGEDDPAAYRKMTAGEPACVLLRWMRDCCHARRPDRRVERIAPVLASPMLHINPDGITLPAWTDLGCPRPNGRGRPRDSVRDGHRRTAPESEAPLANPDQGTTRTRRNCDGNPVPAPA